MLALKKFIPCYAAALCIKTHTALLALCGASHKANNAESAVMRTPHRGMLDWRHGMTPLLRIIVGAFSKAMSLSVALKRPVRSFGAIAASRVSSFTVGSARV